MNPPAAHPRLLYFAGEDWAFCLHRLPLARAALHAGYEVVVVTRVRSHGARITAAGLRLIPVNIARGGMHPWRELRMLLDLVRIYRNERPDIVHHVAVKPVLYGSFVASLAGVRAIVNALTGMGFLFTSKRWTARLLRPAAELALRVLLNRRDSRVIFQNADDLRTLTASGIIKPGISRLIRGSGVDTAAFTPSPEPAGLPLVILPARLLWDKGIGEFVAAARLLRQQRVRARFALVGDRDPENPAVIPQATLDAWREEGAVELWGWRDDMAQAFRDCHVVCLPSYREGLPKALLEAAACGRPLVSCDVEGCREVVRHGKNGLLVPLRDPAALAAALKQLIENPALRVVFGRNARSIVVSEFSLDTVIEQTLALYREILPA